MAYELKTKVNDGSVEDFINSVQDSQKKDDCKKLLKIFSEVTGKPAKMWGDSIVGFDSYSYTNSSGKKLEWLATGFSPRKQNLTVYIMSGFKNFDEYLAEIGPAKTGKGCLYFKSLSQVDEGILKKLIKDSVKAIKSGKIEY